MSSRDLIFVSYSHADEDWLGRLRIFFKAFPWGVPYKQGGLLWADRHIWTGEVWRREIGEGLTRARIGLLLISPDFLASDFIREVELPSLLEAAASGDVTLVCVPIRTTVVDLAVPDLLEYQWPHPPNQPIDRLGSADREAALAHVFREVYELAKAGGLLDLPVSTPGGAPAAKPMRKRPMTPKPVGVPGRLVGVPDQRPHFMPRPDLRDRVRAALLSGRREAIGLTGPRRVGVFGQGGLGKTVTAIDLVHDEEIRRSFSDGVYWVTLGQTPDLIALQSILIQLLAETDEVVSSVPAGIERLRELLAERACLIVLDDVWRFEHAQAFDAGGPRTKLLTTTRDASINTALGAETVALDVLDEGQGLHLLSAWSGRPVEDLGVEAQQLVERCGYLPLAIAVAGAMLRDDITWGDMLAALEEGNLRFLDHPYGNVFTSLRLSIDALPEGQRERYLELAVVPEDIAMPVEVISRLWAWTAALTDLESRKLLTELQGKSLLYLEGQSGERQVRFHDLHRDFLYLAAKDVGELHRRLLDAFEMLLRPSSPATQRSWWTLPSSVDYLWHHLAHHLVKADLEGELRALLLDYGWIAEKLRMVGVVSLVADYELLSGDPVTARVQGALRLAAHVVEGDTAQLPSQLTGRLFGADEPELQTLLAQVEQKTRRVWLRPITRSLTPPGGLLLRTLAGHGSTVNSLAVTPDSKVVVSGSDDRTVKVWDLTSGTLLHTLEGHEAWVRSVAVTTDGKRMVSASIDGTLKVWDIDSGALLHTPDTHDDWIANMAVTPDGERMVTGSDYATREVWDTASGVLLHTIESNQGLVSSVATTPDGEWLILGSDDGTIEVWDLANNSLLHRLAGHEDSVTSIIVTHDGERAVSCSDDGDLRVWQLSRGELLHTLKADGDLATSAAVTPDGARVVSGTSDGTLVMWDLSSGELLHTLERHGGVVTSVAVTPDGKRLVSGSTDGTIKVWKLATSVLPEALEVHGDSVTSVAAMSDGKRAVSGSSDGTFKVWDLTSGRQLHTIQGHRNPVIIVGVSANRELVVSSSRRRTLRVWDLAGGALLDLRQDHKRWVNCVAITPDGERLIAGSSDRTLKVWDLINGTLLHTLIGHQRAVTSVTVTPDGEQVVSGSRQEGLNVWDLTSGELLHTLGGNLKRVMSLAVTPDGKRVVSGFFDGTLQVWDLNSGSLLHMIDGHAKFIASVAVTPDGTRMASGSPDRTLRVWDVKSGQAVAAFTADAAIRSCAAVGRDTLVAGDDLGRIHILRIANG